MFANMHQSGSKTLQSSGKSQVNLLGYLRSCSAEKSYFVWLALPHINLQVPRGLVSGVIPLSTPSLEQGIWTQSQILRLAGRSQIWQVVAEATEGCFMLCMAQTHTQTHTACCLQHPCHFSTYNWPCHPNSPQARHHSLQCLRGKASLTR